jgi:hypothetical protein
MSNESESQSSSLVEAIENRPRRVFVVDMSKFLGLAGKQMETAAVRVLVEAEEIDALVKAHKQVKEAVGDVQNALQDEDLLVNTKTIHAIWRAFRRNEPGDAEKGYMYPAFPSPTWMQNNLTTDELGALLHIYNDWRRHSSTIDDSIDLERLRGLARAIHKYEGSDLPEALLAGLDREWVVQAFILLALELGDANKRLDERDVKDSQEAHPIGGDSPGSDPGGSGGGSGEGVGDQEVSKSDGEPRG